MMPEVLFLAGVLAIVCAIGLIFDVIGLVLLRHRSRRLSDDTLGHRPEGDWPALPADLSRFHARGSDR